MKPVALIDTCALFPMCMRDLVLQLAFDGLFQIKWSVKIENELKKNLKLKYGIDGKKSVLAMRKAIPDHMAAAAKKTLVEVKKSKTDKKDLHVLAAAIDSGCNKLVTFNLKDFDKNFARLNGVTVEHPDKFFYSVINSNRNLAKQSLVKLISRKKNPSTTQSLFADVLLTNGLMATSVLVRSL